MELTMGESRSEGGEGRMGRKGGVGRRGTFGWMLGGHPAERKAEEAER